MDNIKNDSFYIQKIRTDLEFVRTHMRGVDIEELNEKALKNDIPELLELIAEE